MPTSPVNTELINALCLMIDSERHLNPQLRRWSKLSRSMIRELLLGNYDARPGDDWQLVDGFYVYASRAEVERMLRRVPFQRPTISNAETSDTTDPEGHPVSEQDSAWSDG
eukprot:TRINITY_DN32500_c0_g1_i1.p1 TRINITY_DN32500_c0_g1~~TRINITY_DN32500_c0_g1_i1.p1  ORF type:complete len:111 (+),score=5.16 TRINITY_DN32500_c0_g1_i1:204-536(+)